MSQRGPKRIEPKFYGRTFEFEVVRSPNKLLALGIFLVLLPLAVGWILMGDPHWGGREYLVAFTSPFLLVIGVLALFGSWSVRHAPPVSVKLGLKKARIPRGRFVWTLAEEEVPLREIGPIERWSAQHGTYTQFTMPDGKKTAIQDAWIPPEHGAQDFVVLLQLRREMAIRGRFDRVAQTALEAQIFEADGDALGVVVDTRGKRPKPLAIVYDLDDYAALMSEKGFPHARHKLVVPQDRLADTRDAVEAAALASFELSPERLRAQRNA